MLKTILISVAFMASVIALDFKDFPDRDAFTLAQQDLDSNRSYNMFPPKELYDRIHNDLEAIRKTYPQVSHIHTEDDIVNGKLRCPVGRFSLDKLNSSHLGPIKVEEIGNKEHLITFSKPYDYLYLGRHMGEMFGALCGGLLNVGIKDHIYNFNDLYTFESGHGNCFEECNTVHTWHFRSANGTAHLLSENIRERNASTPKPVSTTIKY